MSLGQTASAPASTWLTAVRAISSSDASLSISTSPRSTPQWPWVGVLAEADVRQQQQLREARAQLAARWTIPSSSQAPEPSSSFSSGMPKRITAETPADERAGLADEVVDREAAERRRALVAERLGRDEERHDEVVERERRLADEVAQRAGAAQPAQTGDGIGAHPGKSTREVRRRGLRLRGAGRSADTGGPAAHAHSRADRPLFAVSRPPFDGRPRPGPCRHPTRARRRSARRRTPRSPGPPRAPAARRVRPAGRRCWTRRGRPKITSSVGGAEARSPSPSARRCAPRPGG